MAKIQPKPHTPSAPREEAGPPPEHRSDAPGRRDPPGTGQPGDEIAAPPEVLERQEMEQDAIAAGLARPPLHTPAVDLSRPSEEQCAPEGPPPVGRSVRLPRTRGKRRSAPPRRKPSRES